MRNIQENNDQRKFNYAISITFVYLLLCCTAQQEDSMAFSIKIESSFNYRTLHQRSCKNHRILNLLLECFEYILHIL